MNDWTYTEDSLPKIPKTEIGVRVWITYARGSKTFVTKGHYTEEDATGFHWWVGSTPVDISSRGIKSTFGGEVFAWKYRETIPKPAKKRIVGHN